MSIIGYSQDLKYSYEDIWSGPYKGDMSRKRIMFSMKMFFKKNGEFVAETHGHMAFGTVQAFYRVKKDTVYIYDKSKELNFWIGGAKYVIVNDTLIQRVYSNGKGDYFQKSTKNLLKLEYSKKSLNFRLKVDVGITMSPDLGKESQTKGHLKGKLNWSNFKVKVKNGKFKKGEITIDAFNPKSPNFEVELDVYYKKEKIQEHLVLPITCKGELFIDYSAEETEGAGREKRSFARWLLTKGGKEDDGMPGIDGDMGKKGPVLHVYLEEYLLEGKEYTKITVYNGSRRKVYFQAKEDTHFVLFAKGGKGGSGGTGESVRYSKEAEYDNLGNEISNSSYPKYVGGAGGNGGPGGEGGIIIIHSTKERFESMCSMKLDVTGGNGGNGAYGGEGSGIGLDGRSGSAGGPGKTGIIEYRPIKSK